MQSNTLPLISYPSNIMLLDDDRRFMNLVAMNLDEDFSFVMKDDPHDAIEYLKSHALYPSEIIDMFAEQTYNFDHNDKDSLNKEFYTLNINALKGNLSSPNRFKKVFTVVVDRRMPAMDGLDFCKHIRKTIKLPVKLILLTGATNINEAIDAFNGGIIDAFIQKTTEPNMLLDLNDKIKKLTWEHLSQITQQVAGIINQQLSHLSDSKFHEQFEKIRETNNVKEFYLIDSSGSFLLVDGEGSSKIFFVRKEDDFNDIYELAKDSGALKNVLQNISDRQHYPFTFSGIGHLSLKGDAWDDIMIPMRQIPDCNIFYSVVDMTQPEIVSYNLYRGEIWPEP